MRRLPITVLCLVLWLPVSSTVVAQSAVVWKVLDVRPVTDLIPGDYSLVNVFLAPDGSRIAWTEDPQTLCFYTFADESVSCDSVPEQFRLQTSRYSVPAWSPDGRTIAFHDNFFVYFRDSDLWLYDVEAGVFRNATNDGFMGNIGFESVETPPQDYAPVWHPVDGDLYFFRTVRFEDAAGDFDYTTELYRVGTDGRAADLVRDMTDELPTLSVYLPPAFSADGTRLAFIVAPSNVAEDERTGVWVYNLEDDSLEQVADLADLQQGLPAFVSAPTTPYELNWAGDQALVLRTEDFQRAASGPAQNAYYIDLATGDVTPFVDLSDVDNVEAYIDSDEGDPPVFQTPFAGAVAPDGSTYWSMNLDFRSEGDGGITAYSLPPDGSVTILHRQSEFRSVPRQELPPSASSDGKLLIWGWLVTFVQP